MKAKYHLFALFFLLTFSATRWSWAELPEGADAKKEKDPIERHLALEAEKRIATDLQFLASDELRGRSAESGGLDRAADYIANRWKSLGLETDLFGDSPFQTFTIPGAMQTPTADACELVLLKGGELTALKLEEDYRPLAIGGNGNWSGALCFAGYGMTIASKDLQYDDYRDIDARNKIAIILRKEWRQNDPNSPLDGTKPTKHAYFTTKLANAVSHGAQAILFINDSVTAKANGDQLLQVEEAGQTAAKPSIPAMFVHRALVDKLLAQSGQPSLEQLEAKIDEDLQPRSFDIPSYQASGKAKLELTTVKVKNVLGMIPGRGRLAEETIVIGAHYDHVGMGGPGSLAPGTIAVHNGADDNASGTTALLEIARKLSLANRRLPSNETDLVGWKADEPIPPIESLASDQRRILFIAFTAEERGLLGSRYYVDHPRYALESTASMLNLDMVGRLSDGQLIVYGTGTGTGFDSLLDSVNSLTGFRLKKQREGLGPSDHQPFYERQIPVLHWFTGLHNDYHRPSDDFEKINTGGMVVITDMVYQIANRLATSSDRPRYLAVTGKADIRIPIERRARLGIRMKTEPDTDQIIVEAVAEGSPAQRAELRIGDRIIAVDDKQLDNPQDLIELLSKKEPGKTVEIELVRGDETLKIPVVLGQ